jgi:uncharacterized integral membrane protein
MADDPHGTRINARLIVGAIAVILVVAFAWANSKRVSINFLVGTHDARLIYVILGSALLGAIAGSLLGRRRRRHRND